MIKVDIEGERKPTEARVILNFRRHKQHTQPSNSEKVFLTLREILNEGPPVESHSSEFFVLSIDGKSKVVKFRPEALRKLGFEVRIFQNEIETGGEGID